MITKKELYALQQNHTVGEILSIYFEVPQNKLMHNLIEDEPDIIYYWSGFLAMGVQEIITLLESSLDKVVNFKVTGKSQNVKDVYYTQFDFGRGIILKLDWFLEK